MAVTYNNDNQHVIIGNCCSGNVWHIVPQAMQRTESDM